MASSSSATRRKPLLQQLHLQQPPFSSTTSAPPPTPSAHPAPTKPTTTINLSHLLQRLSPAPTTTTPPLISLSTPTPSLLSAATELGFFHLSHDQKFQNLSSAATSLFNLPENQKHELFPNAWPLGYDDDVSSGESFCVDPLTLCSDWAGLREFGLEMEKLGLKVVEELAGVAGFKNPARDELCSLLWISDDEINKAGRVYPYVVGLHCRVMESGSGRYSVMSDSGWVDVLDREHSVLVTLGDIAQVWSNGKLKKVRGRPKPSSTTEDNTKSNCITLSLLITLPVNSSVSPQVTNLLVNGVEEQELEDNDEPTKKLGEIAMQFDSFSFEDYAWRVYHDRLLLNDPVVKYRV